MRTDGFHDRIDFDGDSFPLLLLPDKRVEPGRKMPNFGMSWHEELEIKYVCEGSTLVTLEETRFSAVQGDIVVVNPFESHMTESGPEGVRYHLLLCPPRYFSGRLGGRDDKNLYSAFAEGRLKFPNLIREKEVTEAFVRLFREEGEGYGELSRIGGLYRLFSALFAGARVHVAELSDSDLLSDKRRIEPALARIFSLEGDLSLEALASLCCVNKYYFARLFKSATHISPHDYICRVREERAEELLLGSEEKIAAIARRTGFEDVCYFSRWFKKTHGVSPVEFRARKSK